jgi:hypothetical protein
MRNQKWILDLSRGLMPEMLTEFTRLAARLDDVTLNEETRDTIRWRFTTSGEYTASSAYLLQFEGSTMSDMVPTIWDGWALGKCKFFIWTAAMNKILTADALLRRGWENEYFCPPCIRNLETPFHLLVECPWSRQIWSALALQFQLPSLNPDSWDIANSIKSWLHLCISSATSPCRKGAHSLLMVASWEIWRELNRRIFQKEELSVAALVCRIHDEASLWNLAGASIPFDPG